MYHAGNICRDNGCISPSANTGRCDHEYRQRVCQRVKSWCINRTPHISSQQTNFTNHTGKEERWGGQGSREEIHCMNHSKISWRCQSHTIEWSCKKEGEYQIHTIEGIWVMVGEEIFKIGCVAPILQQKFLLLAPNPPATMRQERQPLLQVQAENLQLRTGIMSKIFPTTEYMPGKMKNRCEEVIKRYWN